LEIDSESRRTDFVVYVNVGFAEAWMESEPRADAERGERLVERGRRALEDRRREAPGKQRGGGLRVVLERAAGTLLISCAAWYSTPMS